MVKFSVFLNRRVFVMHFVSVRDPIHESHCDGRYCKTDVLIFLSSDLKLAQNYNIKKNVSIYPVYLYTCVYL